MPAPGATPHRPSVFASLASHNFRLFAGSQLFSYTGGWVQRIAQDWLVLSLTGSATAVGVTVSLQFLPSVLLSPLGGAAADRYSKRWVLVGCATTFAILAAVLAALTLTGHVRVEHVYVLAFLTGTVVAVDNPTRQSFVTELVPAQHLRSAIGLNSSAFQLGALAGPALSGALITTMGPGWSFAVNAVSFAPPLVALALMRSEELRAGRPTGARTLSLRATVRYARQRPTIVWPMVLAGCLGFWTINLAVTLAAYARDVARSGAGGYGLLSSAVAVGAVAGSLLSARQGGARLRSLAAMATTLGAVELVAGLPMPTATFAVLLALLGAATVLVFTSTNASVQLSSDQAMRGRVMGLYLLVFMGAGALGGPVVGAVDEHLGARTGLLLAGTASLLATVVLAARLAQQGDLRLAMLRRPTHGWRLGVVQRQA